VEEEKLNRKILENLARVSLKDDLEFTFCAQRTIKEVLKEIKVTYEKEW